MNPRHFILSAGALAAIAALPAVAAPSTARLQVYVSPARGSGGAWVEHLRTAGLTVKATEIHSRNSRG